uniref:BamHI-like type II restriction endonuclease n=1 Tax=Desulfovibrio desulfuricans (strain ATCC 27774 / DSM 6949 / MB) TaxID=525146 RepID=B8J492_DESDA
MNIARNECLFSYGQFPNSAVWNNSFSMLINLIQGMEHPVGAGLFAIFPQSGKKHGEGNGVKPIKEILMSRIPLDWQREGSLRVPGEANPGKIDILYSLEGHNIGIEWETGNVSSSHRAINKMLLGIDRGLLSVGILIVPVKNFAQYLTDRIGNFEELEPYFPVWRKYNCHEGALYILGIEHDTTSTSAPRFQKGNDGRALF